ncbi:SDR family NAD(P)-dependent oxidoreductase [Aureispira anguillae]|uniref:SDR family NAD(P)-dependent oxidoreductase n=1 Tax=Aureispira anguillae TaxID=2864201 RepID=A0A915YLS4_9BACT|nr:SDR family NAD(P)-dependent oxidoreductase [Aureispira anguillae]BDS15364.1 SDR family NAD(P)-dependent oxidoreductase [Aureispira anguillae]
MNQNKKFDSTFKATLTGIKDVLFPPKTDKTLNNQDRLDGKTCLVTGSNTGLGFAIATELAKRGGRIIMAVRSGIPQKGTEIQQLSGNSNVQMEFVELSELQSIKDLVLRLAEQQIVIDILVCNAGVVPAGSKQAKNGLDLMFAVNYLSTFYLVNLLLQHQIIQAPHTPQARLIFVSSESHRVDLPIDYTTFGQPISYSAAKVVKFYGYYKLILNIFIEELNRRYANNGKNLSIFTLCPGAVHSNISRNSPQLLKPILWLVFKIFFQTPLQASRPAVYFACSPKLEGQTGHYLHMMQDKKMAAVSYDAEHGQKVWAASEQLLANLGFKL